MFNTTGFFNNIVSSLESYRQNMRLNPNSDTKKITIPKNNVSQEVSQEIKNKRYRVHKLNSPSIHSIGKNNIFENLDQQFNQVKQNEKELEIKKLKQLKQLEIDQLKEQKQLEIQQLKEENQKLSSNNLSMNKNMQNQMSKFNQLNQNFQKNNQVNNQLQQLLEKTQSKLSKTEIEAKEAISKMNELMNEISDLKQEKSQKGGKKKQQLPFKLQPVRDELYKKVEKYNIKI